MKIVAVIAQYRVQLITIFRRVTLKQSNPKHKKSEFRFWIPVENGQGPMSLAL